MPTPTHQPRTPRRPRTAAVISLLALASCATLSACGGSTHAKSATSNGNNAQTATATMTATAVATSANPGGQTANGNTGSQGGTSTGGTTNHGSETTPANGNPNTSSASHKYPVAFVAALHTFTNCVRAHGLNIPEPNLSGHGEIFSRGAVDPRNPNYRTALQACEGDLIAILRAAGGSHIKGLGG